MSAVVARKRKESRTDSSAAFRSWITANGGEVLQPTNPYEVVRFRGANGVSIIYKDAREVRSYVGDAYAAWQAFKAGQPYRIAPAGPRQAKLSVRARTIVERDGSGCFYCGCDVTGLNAATLEHLVSVTHGGPDHISNLFLACSPCNRDAGHLSAPEKIRLRERKRAEVSVAKEAVHGEP